MSVTYVFFNFSVENFPIIYSSIEIIWLTEKKEKKKRKTDFRFHEHHLISRKKYTGAIIAQERYVPLFTPLSNLYFIQYFQNLNQFIL